MHALSQYLDTIGIIIFLVNFQGHINYIKVTHTDLFFSVVYPSFRKFRRHLRFRMNGLETF